METLVLSSWKVDLHLVFIFLGLMSFFVAVSAAALYLFQSSQLKSKHPGKLFLRLPSLDKLDRFHWEWLLGGVILFTIGIVTGLHSSNDPAVMHAVLRDPKVIFSIVACVLYWAILCFRLLAMGRGQKIAVSTVIVFALLFSFMAAFRGAPKAYHGEIKNASHSPRA